MIQFMFINNLFKILENNMSNLKHIIVKSRFCFLSIILMYFVFSSDVMLGATTQPEYIHLDSVDIESAAKLTLGEDLNRVRSSVYLDNPLGTVFSGIGRLTYESVPIATGFVIDDYTFLTSAHSIDDPDATKRYQTADLTKFKFQPAVQNGNIKYNFHPAELSL
ncbi:hypothetical protein [Macrococcus bovicus]|uniref:hypothetical protein n=1 Tax=Macrococcus bovicus TaxID=69968 RepID=UPI0025A4E115|nr:hypothetical protein [Macrococcus bovicus]WJP97299.1 hypothetical protein QSV55_08420 [Macrococcus bovicus]